MLVGVVELADAVTDGASGGSRTSVTLMVTAMVSSTVVSAVPCLLAVGYVDGDAVGSLGLVVGDVARLDLVSGRCWNRCESCWRRFRSGSRSGVAPASTSVAVTTAPMLRFPPPSFRRCCGLPCRRRTSAIFVHVGYVDGDRDGVVAGRVGLEGLGVGPLRLGSGRYRHDYAVGILGFVVQAGSRTDGYLPGRAANLKGAGVRSAQAMSVVELGNKFFSFARHRRADVGSGVGVFGDGAGYAAGVVIAVPLSDQAPLPSAFTARTCTS